MANPALVARNAAQCSKRIVRLGEGLWTAVGYAASTQHLIEGRAAWAIRAMDGGQRHR